MNIKKQITEYFPILDDFFFQIYVIRFIRFSFVLSNKYVIVVLFSSNETYSQVYRFNLWSVLDSDFSVHIQKLFLSMGLQITAPMLVQNLSSTILLLALSLKSFTTNLIK
jgi:hypothetical protein